MKPDDGKRPIDDGEHQKDYYYDDGDDDDDAGVGL